MFVFAVVNIIREIGDAPLIQYGAKVSLHLETQVTNARRNYSEGEVEKCGFQG